MLKNTRFRYYRPWRVGEEVLFWDEKLHMWLYYCIREIDEKKGTITAVQIFNGDYDRADIIVTKPIEEAANPEEAYWCVSQKADFEWNPKIEKNPFVRTARYDLNEAKRQWTLAIYEIRTNPNEMNPHGFWIGEKLRGLMCLRTTIIERGARLYDSRKTAESELKSKKKPRKRLKKT
jgi:hypothetical protein